MPPPFQPHTGQRRPEVQENGSPPSSAMASITFGLPEPAAASLLCNPGILLSVSSRCWEKLGRDQVCARRGSSKPALRHVEATPAFGPAAETLTHQLSPGRSLLRSAQIYPLVLLLPAVGRKHMRTVSWNQTTPNHKIPHVTVRL